MGRLGLIAGSTIRGSEPVSGEDWVVLQRHRLDRYALPHRIDHEANVIRLLDEGCDRILAIGSVGGLRPELGPGTLLCPDDFIALTAAPAPSSFDDERAHRVPRFDLEWRRRVLEAWRTAGVEVVDGGVYWQTRGPRLETRAEIRLIASHAHVVGMTLASEWAMADELGAPYAAVCVVDNLANGVSERELAMEELESGRRENAARVSEALSRVLPVLADSQGGP
ncbi:MAG TPA: MTAP family purine nucleoside phosphorylase [Solirubrobacterales bacterium]|nr:MTAP family purine nucleoside phosphorylase [Solirubrobacterales bacterium]